MPFHLGPWEIGLIMIIILIVFGVGKLPQVAASCRKLAELWVREYELSVRHRAVRTSL